MNPPSGVANSNADYQLIAEPNPKYHNGESMGLKVSYPAEGKKFIEIPSNTLLGRKSISLIKDTDYYLSYLVNTDSLTPGAESLVRLTDKVNTNIILKEFSDKTKGWKRIVHRIKAPKDAVSIFFGTKQTKGVSGKIYFDDIKIEPVLQVNSTGDDSKDYIAKECRLYPDEESLTCSSRNENVIQNGWEGYCLKHDSLNPGVCLQWLPLDYISAASDSGKTAGYKGQYPLYYCAEANANFDLVEPRNGWRKNTDGHSELTHNGGCNVGNFPLIGFHDRFAPGTTHGYCPVDFVSFYYEYGIDEQGDDGEPDYCQGNWVCLPYADNLVAKVVLYGGTADNGSQLKFHYSNSGSYYAWVYRGTTASFTYAMKGSDLSSSYHGVLVANTLGAANSTVTKVPETRKIADFDSSATPYFNSVVGYGPIEGTNSWLGTETSGWYKFTPGLDFDGSSSGDSNSPGVGYFKGAVVRVNVVDNHVLPKPEAELQIINKTTGLDSEPFTPVCNKFVKVLDEEGKGMPWVDRLLNQDLYNSSTPDFFPVINNGLGGYTVTSPFSLVNKFFGISLSLPYGAAVLNGANIAGNAAIGFWTQYNNNPAGTATADKIPLAGRPYGCFDNDNGSCKYLGHCSIDRDVLCLTVDGGGGTAHTCAISSSGSAQTCQNFDFRHELASTNNVVQTNVLKNIFLRSLSSLKLSEGKYVPGSLEYNSKSADAITPLKIEKCSSAVRPDANTDFGTSNTVDTDFCAIFPEIKNVNLYRGNGSTASLPKTASSTWMAESGYYTLKFNTIVDAEQQPLGEITIDWGDGKTDKISNQDSHPDVPHIISHNYGFSSGFGVTERKIRIKITDNWEYWDCFAANGEDCSGL